MSVDAVSMVSGADTAAMRSKERGEFLKISAGCPSTNTAQTQQAAIQKLRAGEEMQREIEGLVRDFAVSKRLNMHYDGQINRVVVTITNGDTQEVIRQIPSAEFISFMKKFKELVGVMIDRRV